MPLTNLLLNQIPFLVWLLISRNELIIYFKVFKENFISLFDLSPVEFTLKKKIVS